MNVSIQNQNIVLARKLLQKKYRKLEGKYLVEGAKLVKEALDKKQEVLYIIVRDDCVSKYQELLCQVEYFSVTQKTMEAIVDTVTDQGIVAVLKKPVRSLCSPNKNALILDHLQDPSNVGAILRTAAAAGYNDIYMIECADPYSPKSIRAGMSAQFCLNLFEGETNEVLSMVKKSCVLLCADMDGEDIFSCSINEQHALLLGNEGNGVRANLKAVCDKIVSLPMANNMESLNVSVSAGILMYTLTNKIR